jgi:hypothetical protein
LAWLKFNYVLWGSNCTWHRPFVLLLTVCFSFPSFHAKDFFMSARSTQEFWVFHKGVDKISASGIRSLAFILREILQERPFFDCDEVRESLYEISVVIYQTTRCLILKGLILNLTTIRAFKFKENISWTNVSFVSVGIALYKSYSIFTQLKVCIKNNFKWIFCIEKLWKLPIVLAQTGDWIGEIFSFGVVLSGNLLIFVSHYILLMVATCKHLLQLFH